MNGCRQSHDQTPVTISVCLCPKEEYHVVPSRAYKTELPPITLRVKCSDTSDTHTHIRPSNRRSRQRCRHRRRRSHSFQSVFNQANAPPGHVSRTKCVVLVRKHVIRGTRDFLYENVHIHTRCGDSTTIYSICSYKCMDMYILFAFRWVLNAQPIWIMMMRNKGVFLSQSGC